MVALKLAALLVTGLNALTASAQADAKDKASAPDQSANLAVKLSASFPNAEFFGVKLVNGHPTQCLLSIQNDEAEPLQLKFIGGALLTPIGVPGAPSPPTIMRNLTTQKYTLQIPAGQAETVTYAFATEMHPQDLTLNLAAIFQDKAGKIYTSNFYNETVSVAEAPVSIFDPQIVFLYLILASVFGGTCYFIYNTWITTLFPQKRRGGKGGERAKRSSAGTKKVDPADQVSVVGADGPAVTSGAQAYDESWIPAHHLNKPQARRVPSGSVGKAKTRAK